jgi:uncharacterized protein YyaL (SSP411 family)
VLRAFGNEGSPFFWFSAENDGSGPEIMRVIETTDGVEPSGNAVMSKVLLYLGHYFSDNAYISRAESMVRRMQARILAYPQAYACWASSAMLLASGIRTLVITGPEAFEYARSLFPKLNANVLIAAANALSALPVFENRANEDKTMIYQCIGTVCQAPVSNPEQLEF